MTLTQLKNSISELGGQIRAAATALATAAADETTPESVITAQRNALGSMNSRMAAMQEAYSAQYDDEAAGLPHGVQPGETSDDLRDMLHSREYARAFANAIKVGASPNRPMTSEKHKVLYDALTISGGDSPGEDGGFLVPEDIDLTIRERRRTLEPLADLFTVEPVNTNSGWRIMDKAPTTGMTVLSGEIPEDGVKADDQPEFAKVSFKLTTYGLFLPVSNELASDEAANLFTYLGNWFAKKQVITENLLLKAKLETLKAVNINTTDDAIDVLKSILNKTLDPAISMTSTILTNQDGFDYLDKLKDKNGRAMLQPDPTNEAEMMFKRRRVRMVANSLLPSRSVTGTGATKGDYYPIYVGDFSQFATLFMRQNLEVTSTDIGGNAYRTNSIEVRGIARMNTQAFDTEAAVRRELFIAAA